jgi:hypothetical protein
VFQATRLFAIRHDEISCMGKAGRFHHLGMRRRFQSNIRKSAPNAFLLNVSILLRILYDAKRADIPILEISQFTELLEILGRRGAIRKIPQLHVIEFRCVELAQQQIKIIQTLNRNNNGF